MLKKVSKTFIVMVITMGASFMATVLLGRQLNPSGFGLYNLLKKIILLGPALGCIGMNMSFTKVYAKEDKIPANAFYFAYLIGIGSSFIITLIVFQLYDFSYLQSILMLIIIFMTIVTKFNTQYYRLKEKYFTGQFVLSGWKLILFLIVAMFLFSPYTISKNDLFLIFLFAFIIPSLIILFYLSPFKGENNGDIKIKSLITFGIVYWVVNSVRMLTGQIENFVIPIVSSNELLGIYSALSFFFIISLRVLATSYGYVIFPEVSKGKSINWKNIIIIFSVIFTGALIIFPLFGEIIIDLLFDGQYNQYVQKQYLIIFTIIGISKAIYAIFHFYIIGKSKRKDLVLYIVLSLFSLILYIVGVIIMNKFFTVNLNNLIYLILFMRIIDLLLISIVMKRLITRENR